MKTFLSASRSAVLVLGCGMSVSRWTVTGMALSLAAWFGVLLLMGGMGTSGADMGSMYMGSMYMRPVTPLGDLPVFLVSWVVMMTAMMLPSELNYIGVFASLFAARGGTSAGRLRAVAGFVAGYGIVWIAYGLAAYLLDSAVRAAGIEMIRWDHAGPLLVASVLIVAGLYQISPLKHVCLTDCRSPLTFFARYWREGSFGAVVMGIRHGLVCVGCCWGLMAVMFAVGVMSLTWMALLTLFIFAEKVLPQGRTLTIPIACFLCVMGIWIAVSPETAPFLIHQM